MHLQVHLFKALYYQEMTMCNMKGVVSDKRTENYNCISFSSGLRSVLLAHCCFCVLRGTFQSSLLTHCTLPAQH